MPRRPTKLKAAPGLLAELKPREYRDLGIAVPSLKNASPAVKKFLDYTTHVLKRDNLI